MKEKIASWLQGLESKKQCDWLGIRYIREDSHYLDARDGHLDRTYVEMDCGVMLEVSLNGMLVYSATDDLTTEGIERAFDKAVFRAKNLGSWKLTSFDKSTRPLNKGLYTPQEVQPFQYSDLSKVGTQLAELSGNLKSRKDFLISANAMVLAVLRHTIYQTTSGTDINQTNTLLSYDMGVTAKRGDCIQRRSCGMPSFQGGVEMINADELSREGDRLIQEVDELLDAPECPNEKLDLILEPDQLYLQVHESIGHPLELDRILGDERNYAGWSFVGLEDFGKRQYGSELLNVTFDPTLPQEMASYGYDDSGVAANKLFLIKDGVLVRGIGGMESQKRGNVDGIASFRASSWNRAPIDRMGNINIEPGKSSKEELFSKVEKGILMRTNRSWSIDDYRNKFQFGCEYGQLIEEGKLTKVVKNPNYRGMTESFWKQLDGVGNESTFEVWGSPYCGKGEPNQIIRVGHAIPLCLFRDIEVFGGAQ